MPESFTRTNGQIDWSKIFMAFAAATVLIIQQLQDFKIAEIEKETRRDEFRIMKTKKIDERINQLERIDRQLKEVLLKQESIWNKLKKIKGKQQ